MPRLGDKLAAKAVEVVEPVKKPVKRKKK